MVNIYNYDDPVNYLNDYFNAKESLDSSFSLKSFAQRSGLKSAAPIIDILRRKKRISSKMAEFFIYNANIDPSEKIYFQALVAKSSSSNSESSLMYDVLLDELKPTNIHNKEYVFRTSKLDLFSHWIYMAIFAMNDLEGFKLSATNIQNKLREKVDLALIEKALFQLFEHKILIRKDNGNIESRFFRVATKSDQKHKSAKQYFDMVCDLAKDAYEVSLNKREFNSFSFTLADEDIPLAKEIIRKCKASLANLSEKKSAENVYQANLMLFPLTKTSEEEGQI